MADPELEKNARDWLAGVVGEPFPEGSFHEALRDGVYLCKAINALSPGSVKKINTSNMAFHMMENIGNFLASCESFGVPKIDMFHTVDLYEAHNLRQVVNGILALARRAEPNQDDRGPSLVLNPSNAPPQMFPGPFR